MIKMFYPVQFNISLNCVHMVGRCRAWHTIIGIGQHTDSDDVRRQMPSSPCIENTMGKCRVWHAIIALGYPTWSDNDRHVILSSSLESTHDRTTSGVATLYWPWRITHCHPTSAVKCYHCPWTTLAVWLHRVCYDIISLRNHTWSNDIMSGIISLA